MGFRCRAFGIVLTMLLGVAGLRAQNPPMTEVTGYVFGSTGKVIAISNTQFTTSDGTIIAKGYPFTAQIGPSGFFALTLPPNVGSTPTGTSYTVTFDVQPGVPYRETWVVPTSGVPITVSVVRALAAPVPGIMVGLAQLQVPTGCGGELLGLNVQGTSWMCVATLANPMTQVGQMIVGGTAGAPVAVSPGTAGYVWTSNGPGAAPAWVAPGSSITYPGAGVALSTGSGWGASYAVGTGANDLPQLDNNGLLPTGVIPALNYQAVLGAHAPVTHRVLTGFTTPGTFTDTQLGFPDLTGTALDSQLASQYSGVGSCGAHQWVSVLNHNAPPTCAQLGYADLTGVPTLYYQTVQASGVAQTQRGKLNFGTGLLVTDDSTNDRQTITVPTMTGDAGSGGSSGLVPPPAAGDAAAGRFLKANATWGVPASSITLNTTAPLGGGGTGNSFTVTCTTCVTSVPVSSVFGRLGAVTAQAGDYLFSQIGGTLTAIQINAAGDLSNNTTGNSGTATAPQAGHSTGSGNFVLATSPTLTTPNLGTPSLLHLDNADRLPLGTGVLGQLSIANGGTGAASFAAAGLPVISGTPVASHCATWVSPTTLGDAGATCATGGSTSPGGSDGQMQFNSSGVFAGTPLVYVDATDGWLGFGGTTAPKKLIWFHAGTDQNLALYSFNSETILQALNDAGVTQEPLQIYGNPIDFNGNAQLNNGLKLGAATGGDKGVGTVNAAAGYYVNGAALNFSNMAGTVSDGQLGNQYSGVGTCGSHQWVSALNHNAAPTCAQLGYADISGTPTLYYQTVQANGTAQTQRGKLNFGTGLTVTDDSGNDRQTITVPTMTGDSGSGGTKGLVPAPAAGDAAAKKYLDAGGTWSVPAGGASTGYVFAQTSVQPSDTVNPDGTGIGTQLIFGTTYTFAANQFCASGVHGYTIRDAGSFNTAGGANGMYFDLNIGSSVVTHEGVYMGTVTGDRPWYVEATVICVANGTSGKYEAHGFTMAGAGASNQDQVFQIDQGIVANTAPFSVDTTGTVTVSFSVDRGQATGYATQRMLVITSF